MRGGSGATVPASSSGGASAKGKVPTESMKEISAHSTCNNGIDTYRYQILIFSF